MLFADSGRPPIADRRVAAFLHHLRGAILLERDPAPAEGGAGAIS
jgi:hypothetical protein